MLILSFIYEMESQVKVEELYSFVSIASLGKTMPKPDTAELTRQRSPDLKNLKVLF